MSVAVPKNASARSAGMISKDLKLRLVGQDYPSRWAGASSQEVGSYDKGRSMEELISVTASQTSSDSADDDISVVSG